MAGIELDLLLRRNPGQRLIKLAIHCSKWKEANVEANPTKRSWVSTS
jgi:hypothetical protein